MITIHEDMSQGFRVKWDQMSKFKAYFDYEEIDSWSVEYIMTLSEAANEARWWCQMMREERESVYS